MSGPQSPRWQPTHFSEVKLHRRKKSFVVPYYWAQNSSSSSITLYHITDTHIVYSANQNNSKERHLQTHQDTANENMLRQSTYDIVMGRWEKLFSGLYHIF